MLGPGAAELGEDLGIDLTQVLDTAEATGETGEVTELPVVRTSDLANSALSRVLMIGVGAGTPTDLRRAGATLARRTTNADAVASSLSAVGDDDVLAAFVEGATLGSFGFSMRKDGPRDRPVGRIALALTANDDDRSARLRRAVAPCRRQLAGPTSRERPLQHQDARVAGRAGRHRRRGRRAEDHRARREAARRAWLRRSRRRRPGCGRTAAVRADRLPAGEGRPQGQARGAGRQGHHLRQRRSLHQARRSRW